MPVFTYKARTAEGRMAEGTIEAENRSAAADRLLTQGLMPIDLEAAPAEKQRPEILDWIEKKFQEKVRPADLMLFSRQLHALIKAGVPILGALAGLQESASKAMASAIADMRRLLESGHALSTAMARQGIFSRFYLAMIQVGEITGRLEEVLLRLYHHLEFEQFMRQQVKSALRYPTFVLVAMAGAIAVVNLFVIPAFAKVFQGFGAELPWLTRLLLAFSDFMVRWWWVIALGLLAAVVGFRGWVHTEPGRLRWDRMKLSIPIAGRIVRKATLARFARSLALALKSGVPVVQAMHTVTATVDNLHVAQAIDRMREGVERGESLLRVAASTGIFTPVVLQMIAVGEESGLLDQMLEEVAGFYQQEVEYELKTLAQQIEPILIVALGVLVLILALGIFLPMWDLGRVALRR